MKKIFFILVILVNLLVVNLTAADIKTTFTKLRDPKTHALAIKELEQIGKSDIPQLRMYAKDTNNDKHSRVASIMLLGKLKADKAKDDLKQILEKDNDKFCREASAMALGKLGDKGAIPELKNAMNDQSGNVRMRVIKALAQLGDNSGKQLALAAIKGNNVTEQFLAVEALETIGDKSMINELQKNLESDNIWTRIHSQLAIKKLEILGLSQQKKTKFLEEVLKDEQLEVNRWAAQELVKMDTPEAFSILKQTAKDADIPGNYAVRKELLILIDQGKITKDDLK